MNKVLKRGLFIVLEGVDGSGKTTIARCLKMYLEATGLDNIKITKVVVTQEPTEGPIGRILREYLKKTPYEKRDPIFEALLFAADRRWHIINIIKPALSENAIVISDRYYYSSIAYQTTDGVSEKWILEINKGILKPDLAFFLDIRPEVSLSRITHKPNIFERLEFLKMVYEKYVKLCKEGYLIRINANKDINEIVSEIITRITEYLLRLEGSK